MPLSHQECRYFACSRNNPNYHQSDAEQPLYSYRAKEGKNNDEMIDARKQTHIVKRTAKAKENGYSVVSHAGTSI
jgi:hypothetical protein